MVPTSLFFRKIFVFNILLDPELVPGGVWSMVTSALSLRGYRNSPLTFVNRLIFQVHSDRVIRLRNPASDQGE